MLILIIFPYRNLQTTSSLARVAGPKPHFIQPFFYNISTCLQQEQEHPRAVPLGCCWECAASSVRDTWDYPSQQQNSCGSIPLPQPDQNLIHHLRLSSALFLHQGKKLIKNTVQLYRSIFLKQKNILLWTISISVKRLIIVKPENNGHI